MAFTNSGFQIICTLLALFFVQNKVEALKCYTCTATEANSDCQLHPEIVPGGITNCNKKYCTLRRVEYMNSGQVYSFYRSCEDNPVYVNTIIEDDTYRTFFKACSTGLCNGGAGKETNSDSQQNLPPGVTKPAFNDKVLYHGNASAKLKSGVIVQLILLASVMMAWKSLFN